MQRVKKLLVLPAALLLSSCTVMDVVGPRANGEIMTLAKQASADWVFGEHPEWRELRKFQSEQLQDEALRLCGTDETGQTPQSCNVGYGDTDLPAPADAAALLEHTVTAADKVPDDSVDLVVAQAIDALALAPVDLSIEGPITNDATFNAATELLAAENAMYYGLGIALAYADGALRTRVAELREASHERTEALAQVIGEQAAGLPDNDAEALVPAAGYTFAEGYAEPSTTQEATELVETMHSDLVKQWRLAAADAESKPWRKAAIQLAAHAQRS